MIFRLAFFLGINPNLFNNQIWCNMAINIHKILSDTLLELCKEKKLQSITVQDILKRSGVSRQAFYTFSVSLVEQGTGVEPFLVQIHPPLTFSDYFAQLI